MSKYTVADIMKLKPCYDIQRVEQLWDGREALSLAEICRLNIELVDIIWVVSRLLPERAVRLFACDCAEHVLQLFECEYPDDKRPRECIDMAQEYAKGNASEEELDAARSAGWAAVSTAASAAAGSASNDAVKDAARDAARAAAWSAAYDDAAIDAASDAVRSAACAVVTAARAATSGAVSDAACDVVSDAARAAGWAAACDAVRAAVSAEACRADKACVAASTAAERTERKWQLDRLIEYATETGCE